MICGHLSLSQGTHLILVARKPKPRVSEGVSECTQLFTQQAGPKALLASQVTWRPLAKHVMTPECGKVSGCKKREIQLVVFLFFSF